MGESYRQLIAWQKSMDLVEAVYRCTRHFPREEMYCLTVQVRRAAISVASNIAEGQARHSQKEFHHFLTLARGSLVEIETQIEIAARLKYVDAAETGALLERCAELGRILNGLIASIATAGGD